MASDRALAAALLVGLATFGACRAGAQVKVVALGVDYESPGLVAPVALLTLLSESRTWTIGVLGPTGSVEYLRVATPERSILLRAEATPWGANGSRYAYLNGERIRDGGFQDGSGTLAAGFRFTRGDRHAEIRAMARDDWVSGLPDSIARRWRAPSLGVGAGIALRHLRSEDVFRARFEGVKLSADGAVFVGPTTWWQSTLMASGGTKLGGLFLRGSGAVLLSGGTDIVSDHLVGGSWDLSDAVPLYGHRYAEFRVSRAVVAAGGADVRLHDDLDLGLRYGWFTSPSQDARGIVARLSTVWNGLTVHVGAGVPTSGPSAGGRRVFIFSGISGAALK